MRSLLLLLAVVVAAVSAQGGGFFSIPRRQNRQRQFRPQQRPRQQLVSNNNVGDADDANGSSQYHYSWRHGQSSFTGGQAKGYCRGLGNGWAAISINDGGEDAYIQRVIRGERLEYIWTGGSRRGRGWNWEDGSGLDRYRNWSHTGGARRPQPDNRERAGETCLAILNNFYNDGVKWHDVNCSHRKPVICERRAGNRG